jgi:Undecaprenyl-phosphate glucose phosphotransferase
MQAADEAIVAEIPSGEPGDAAPGQRTEGPRLRFTSNIVGPVFLAADIFCLLLSAPMALAAYGLLSNEGVVPSVHLFAYAAVAASYLMIRSSKRAYRRTLMDLLHEDGDAIVDGVVSALVASALVWQFGMIDAYSRGVSLLFLLSFVTCITLSRIVATAYLRRLARRGLIEQRIAFYGADPGSTALIMRVLDTLDLPHLKFIGVADDRPRVSSVGDLPLIGGFDELISLARRGHVDQVLISVQHMPRQRLDEIVDELSAVSIDVSIIPPQAIEFAPDYRVHLLGTIPVLTLWQRPFRDINQFVKRAEDVVVAGIALVLLSPILAAAALLIRLTSPGPILFVQPRTGFNNEVIDVLKFRTMYAEKTDLNARETTTRDDPRITPVGRVLRKLSIDELPQLINVFKGEMSLVGPRPHALEMKVGDRYYHDAVQGYAGRHRVRPGMTGLAQVKGLRGEIRTIERAKRRVELDKEYIDRWSLTLDLWIMLATVRAVLFDRDAY